MVEKRQTTERKEPIAIVGMGLRFPGGAKDTASFWEMLCEGRDCITEIPADRWNIGSHYFPNERRRAKSKTKWGGFIEDIRGFDADFFGISPREAETLDPQQRLLLEVCWQALEDAGVQPAKFRRSRTGVFVGGFTLDYMIMQLGGTEYNAVEPHTATGAMMTLLSNRLSHVFGFNGPSVSMDTACSSSLVAVHYACRSILNGECDAALAGGVNALLTPGYFVAESQAGMLSPTGRSRAFDSRADGYVRGEGAGLVLLKPLSRALADNDRIYALIKASAVNQDGDSQGLTVPSGRAQIELMREAYSRAGISPADVVFVEAHGTGTPVGDPIEANSIGTAVLEGRDNGRCYIGSVKTNIGHTEAAAGVAGLIKAALSIYHRSLPPHVHLQEVNPQIDLDKLKLEIPKQLTPLTQPAEKLFAGVNSFGFGGTNAHVVLQAVDPVSVAERKNGHPRDAYILPLSARSEPALRETAAAYGNYLANAPSGQMVSSFAHSVGVRREQHALRGAVVANNTETLIAALKAAADGEQRPGVLLNESTAQQLGSGDLELTWVFSGMGPQWWGMGRELYRCEKVFRQAVDRVCERFEKAAGWSLRDELFKAEDASRMEETQVAQPASFAVQIGLAELWRSWGMRPAAVVGHSAGEPAAAYVAGALSFDDAVDVVLHRSRLQQKTTGQGKLIALGLGLEEAEALIAECGEGRLSIAAINSPTALTVAGDNDSIEQLRSRLENTDIFAKVLRVNVPYHSHVMDGLRDELMDSLAHIRPRVTEVTLYSTVTGEEVAGTELDANYWFLNMREPVRFFPAIAGLAGSGQRAFLEIGAHPVLSGSVKETLDNLQLPGHCWHSLRRGQPEQETILTTLGALYAHGFEIDWREVYAEVVNPTFTPYPTYPWQHQSFWSEPEALRDSRLARSNHPILARRLNTPVPTWETDLDYAGLDYMVDHRIQGAIVFPGAGYMEMALTAARELYGETGSVELTDIRFRKALYIEQDRPVCVRLVFNQEDGNFQVYSRDYGRPEAQWRVNAEGCILLRHSNGRAAEIPATIQSRCQRLISQDLCYRHFKTLGLEYGPRFRGIGQLQQGIDEVLARVALPEAVAGQLDDYRIHPVLLDICLQTMAATLPIEDEPSSPPKVYMPVSLNRLKVHGGFTHAQWIHARLLKRSDDELLCDINLLDGDGRVLLCIEECKARSFGNGNARMETRPQHLYRMAWREQLLEVTQQVQPAGGVWLVFGDNDVFERALLSGLKGQARQFVVVHRGDAFAAAGQGYTVSPGSVEDFTRLLEHVRNRYPEPIKGVVYLWPAACENTPDIGPADAEPLLERSCTGFLHLVQSLGRLGQKTPPRLWAVTSNAQAVTGDAERLNVLQASLWGLARVAGQIEYRDLWKAVIDIDRPSHPQTAGKLANEILNGDGEDQVAYRKGVRYVARLKSCDELRLPTAPAFRPDVSYLITGGLGALGLVTAEWMIERGARHLILAGRGELPPRREWAALSEDHRAYGRVAALRKLESLGASVTVAALDIADFEQLRDFVETYEGESRPAILGVIHAAGVATPKLIDEMSAEELRATLRPKVNGALCLHRVFSERELDFFVLFSSIASVVVSDGQAAYAAANAFLDAFAHWRHAGGRGGLSINWGPWGEIGMAADLNLVDFFRSRGFYAMTTAQGLEAFGSLLGERTPQAVVVAADWRTVASTGFQAPPPYLEELLAEQADTESEAAETGDGEQDDFLLDYMSLAELSQRRALLERHLASLACRVLRIDIGKLGCDESLNTKGMDSMMAMELKNRIERSLGASVAIVELLRGASIATIADKLIDHLEERLSQASEELNSLMGKIESGETASQVEQTGIEEKV